MISIKEIAKKDIYTLSSSDSVGSVVELKEKRDVDYLLVEEEGEIKGVVTSHELVGYPSSRLLMDCKIKPIATISEETWLNEALKVLEEEEEVNFLVILNRKGSPIGVINKEIIISFLYQEIKKSNKEKEREITERKRAEEALKESRDAYQATFEATGTAMLIGEEDTTISMINAEFEKLCGYSKEEVEGKKSWIDFLVKADQERMKEYHNLRMTDPNAAPPYYEFQFIDKQGNVRDCFITLDLIPGTKKTVGSLIDITERKRADEEKRKAQADAVAVLDGMIDVVGVSGMDGRITRINEGVEAWGYKKEELIGKNIAEFIAKRSLPKLMGERERTLEEGVIKNLDLIGLKSDGSEFPVLVNVTLMQDTEGKPTGRIFAVRDITERKRAEEEVKKSQVFLATIIDNIPDTVTIRDSQHRFVLVNQAYCNIVGHTKEEVIGKTAYWKMDKEVFQTGKGLDISEQTYTNLEGKRHYVSVKKAPLTDESGKPTHVLTISRDITDRKRAEEKVKEAYRLREHFLKETSHRIITPVAIIGGNIDLLLDRGNLDDAQKEKIRIIRERNEEVQKLVRDALAGKYLVEEEEEEEEGGEG